jgi:hypothetical protein
MPKQAYHQKVINCINDNSFVKIPNNRIEQYQKAIRSSVSNNNSVIKITPKYKFINLDPQPPNLRELVKLHK